MKLITVRGVTREVAKQWREQYPRPEDRVGKVASKEHLAIGERLAALNLETATRKQVADIIGNDGWTAVPGCSECRRDDLERVLRIGEDPHHYESKTAYLCEECAMHAVEAFITGKDRPRKEPEPFDF